MSTYVLIHGSWHGAWCWFKVVARLEKAGHKVVAPDLPGLGRDRTPVAEISPDTWSDHVCRVLDGESDPVILVGHSLGGLIISQVAEKRPEKVRTLVYLTAILLRNGETLLRVARDEDDGTSWVIPNLITSEDESYSYVRPEAIKDVFYHDCPDEDVALAGSLLVPVAMKPMKAPLAITDERFGRIPRVYIECLQDRATPPSLQKRMYSASPCQRIIPMDTSHSPFFSRPDELVAHLTSL